jgi:putative membrane protein
MNSTLFIFFKQYATQILIAILIIFHTVGLVGLSMPAYREQFLELSFMNLMLSFVVLIASRKEQMNRFLLFLGICFITGMAVEWIGIHTGLLFGDYQYGSNLGVKLAGVPLIIGVNWGVLSVSACTISELFRLKVIPSAILSAALMTGLDFLIEPVAIVSDYWTWNSSEIPLFNYLCWFLIAIPLHYVYFRWKLVEKNKVAIALFIILALFFIILNF